jgi:hypothetical protein
LRWACVDNTYSGAGQSLVSWLVCETALHVAAVVVLRFERGAWESDGPCPWSVFAAVFLSFSFFSLLLELERLEKSKVKSEQITNNK